MVTNSIKTLKMTHIKNKCLRLFSLVAFKEAQWGSAKSPMKY